MEDQEPVPGLPPFGMLLRRHRLSAGLSQEALAERARMSTNGIGALERGYRRTPQRETLALLAAALTLDGDDLRQFQAAAVRSGTASRAPASVMTGPWPSTPSPELPVALTSFVGRKAEFDEIGSLVRDHRLVTITGTGGVGKTQIALRVGAELAESEGALCFVSLAPVHSPSSIVTAIASALGVQEVPERPLLETLVAYLRSRTVLLLLDNCEHVISEAANVAEGLLRGCVHLRILATSREPLKAGGEYAYRLPSLRIPSFEAAPRLGASDAVGYGAIALFLDRARAVDHSFAVTDDNAPMVAEICRRLDGIPLAIELAAARTNSLSLSALAEKLHDRFRILTSGERTALPRQQTMRAAIDWSYQLLSLPEQLLFERLAAFAGGCTLDSATAVCTDETNAAERVLDLLSSLVDKSLLVAELGGREPRYRLLESAKQYAGESLAARGETESVARRHAAAYLALAQRLNRAYDTVPDDVWIEMAKEELDNWRSALDWALVARHDVALGQRLAGELAVVWSTFAPVEGRRWIALAHRLADTETPQKILADLNYADANIAGNLGEALLQLTRSEEALAHYRALDDEYGIALSLSHAGRALVWLGRVSEAEPKLREAVAHARRLGVRKHLGHMLRGISFASNVSGDLAAARTYVSEAIAIYEEIGARRGAAMALASDLAEVELHAGNAELALHWSSEALPILRAFNGMAQVAEALNNMSACLICLARYDEAEEYAVESILMTSEHRASSQLARALQRLAAVMALRQEDATVIEIYECTARIFGFVDARLAALGSPRYLYDQEEYDRVVALVRNRLGASELARLMEAGANMTEDDAIGAALGACDPNTSF
ncbi:MAG: helix-turn-helix domain-containing protein [Candidatus Tumulicola sp.]